MIFLGKELIPHKSVSIVAEVSCNHEGDLDQALALIKSAKDSGADAVKIQAYTPEEMTIDCHKYVETYESITNEFLIHSGPWKGQSLWELYQKTYTPLEWVPALFNYAANINIPIFTSVFGEKSLAALEAVNCPAYKIASFELNDINLIKMVAEKNKLMVLSTGVATKEERLRAINIIEDISGIEPLFMHCVSKYPARIDEMNLAKILDYQRQFDYCGFSDHTVDGQAAQIAISLGAVIIEKHLSINIESADAKFSLLPHEFREFVWNCQNTIKALQIKDEEPARQFKRSLYVVKDIKQGELFTHENLKSIRPGYGLDPARLPEVIGKYANNDLLIGTALKEEYIA